MAFLKYFDTAENLNYDIVQCMAHCLLHAPIHLPPGGRVNVHHILCAWCEHADSVGAHTRCAEALCIATASAGVGASRRQESLFCSSASASASGTDRNLAGRNSLKIANQQCYIVINILEINFVMF
jgi:hypothetical protein